MAEIARSLPPPTSAPPASPKHWSSSATGGAPGAGTVQSVPDGSVRPSSAAQDAAGFSTTCSLWRTRGASSRSNPDHE